MMKRKAVAKGVGAEKDQTRSSLVQFKSHKFAKICGTRGPKGIMQVNKCNLANPGMKIFLCRLGKYNHVTHSTSSAGIRILHWEVNESLKSLFFPKFKSQGAREFKPCICLGTYR